MTLGPGIRRHVPLDVQGTWRASPRPDSRGSGSIRTESTLAHVGGSVCGAGRRPGTPLAVLVTSLAFIACASFARAQVTVEYVAHAAFVIESANGTRIAIDPFNGTTWLGYGFPEHVAADAVLITHPHYDHDASYYFDRRTPVLREPGRYRVAAVDLVGLAAEHGGAERFRARGVTPFNTLWVVQTDGLRIGHVGDNGPLSAENLAAFGPLDILLVRASFDRASLASLVAHTGARIVIPMHYRIPQLSEEPEGLPTVEDWLSDKTADVVRHTEHRVTFERASLPTETLTHVLAPSPDVRPWRPELREALRHAERAETLADAVSPSGRNEAIEHYRTAVRLAPEVMRLYTGLGRALQAAGRIDDAVISLEQGLARAVRDDWTDTLRARALLGRMYADTNRLALATIQFRRVLGESRTYAADARNAALQFFESHR